MRCRSTTGRLTPFSLWDVGRIMRITEPYAHLMSSIEDITGWHDTTLHLTAGLIIFVAARVLTRRSFATMIPLSWVLAAEALNEVMDRLEHGRWMQDTAADVIYTVFVPALLFIGCRAQDAWRGRRAALEARRRN
jgi:hypothetical protein